MRLKQSYLRSLRPGVCERRGGSERISHQSFKGGRCKDADVKCTGWVHGRVVKLTAWPRELPKMKQRSYSTCTKQRISTRKGWGLAELPGWDPRRDCGTLCLCARGSLTVDSLRGQLCGAAQDPVTLVRDGMSVSELHSPAYGASCSPWGSQF